MRRAIGALAGIALLLTTAACSGQQDKGVEAEMKTFPIGLWVSPPANEVTLERYEEMKEAGITFVTGFSEWEGGSETMMKSLDYAEATGMKVILRDPQIGELADGELSGIGELTAPYRDHPAYMGHVFYDEPSLTQYDRLAAMKEEYKKDAPDGLPYVNLFPTYASLDQKGGTYTEYLDQYIQKYKPELISYDHYPFLTEAKGGPGAITEDYFYNLELIRRASTEHQLPFWLFIQTLSFNTTHRDPTEEEIRWQVFTSLAYGAKGIQYFTYWTPQSGRETFGSGMIDLQGNRTRHYDEVKRINASLQEIGPRLMELQSEGVIHFGDQPALLEESMKSFGPIASVSGDPAIIGCFTDSEGVQSVLVVNASFQQPSSTELKLEGDVKRAAVWNGGQVQSRKIAGGAMQVELAPGGAMWIAFNG
ncbi:beta-galactosidase [Paenibacillus sp. J5C_2022]|uniref:beta-galactosidase n=1 Tax=Paenibacillus sp. J5C2022 TaxID=2977129 RepID=UPI0021D27CB7|nr:beta-galactosidase [Paenibacillus sp. J5C2022]MCU6710748.1 beta-galactosidase [Paenibacillus sp. J5C2022]